MTRSRPVLTAVFCLSLALAGCDKGGSGNPAEPAFTGTISGTVTADQDGVAGVSVRLTGAVVREAQSSSSGGFSFSGLSAGSYQVSITALPEHVEFTTTTQSVTLQKGAGSPRVLFSGTVKADGVVFGRVTMEGIGFQGATVTLSGPENRSGASDSEGAFSFANLKRGSYTATLAGFDPQLHAYPQATQSVTAVQAPGSQVMFEGTLIPQPSAAPSGLTATATGPGTTLLVWTDESSDETRFEVHRKVGDEGTWGMVGAPDPDITTFEDVGLSPATTYTYRVRSCNDAGCSGFTNESSATTQDVPPETPTALVASASGPFQVDLTWTPGSTNESRFEVERRLGPAGEWSLVYSPGSGSTSQADRGLSPNTLYGYRVRACNDVGCSAFSTEAEATTDEVPPVAPTAPSATATGSTSVVFSWSDESANETGFEVQRKVGSGGTWAVLATTGADAEDLNDTGLAPNTLHAYRVRACNAVGCSAYTAEASATTEALPPDAPVALSAVATGPHTVDLAWTDASTNEGRFEVEQKPAGGSWAAVGSTAPNATTFEASGLTPVTSYSFRIRACNDIGCSAYSGEAGATTTDVPPTAPSGLGASELGWSQIDLTWTDGSSNETGFRIERKIGSGGTWTLLNSPPTDATSFSDTGLSALTEYFYRVQACNAVGCSGFSNEASATTTDIPPTAPTGLSATATGQTTISVTWTDESNDETLFRLERDVSPAFTSGIQVDLPANTTGYGDTGLTSETTYYYRLAACNAGGCSSVAGPVNATTQGTFPDAPTGLSATATGANTIDLAWTDNADNEDNHAVERRATAGGGFALVATLGPNTTSHTDSGLTPNTEYEYRVSATNAWGASPVSNLESATTWAGSGPNLTIDAMYITQSSQTLLGEVPLVADKDGYLRVFAIASEANTMQPDVRVRFYHGGGLVHTATLSAPGASTPLATDESNLAFSWNMSVPGSLIQPGLSLLADVDPGNAIAEGNEGDNDFPSGGSPQAIDVRTTATFDVTFVPIRQSVNNLVGDVDAGNASQFFDVALQMLPIVQTSATIHAEYVTNAPVLQSNNANSAWSTVLSEIASLRIAESGTGYYYGVVETSYTSGVAGMGYVGWPAAIGWDYLPSGSGVAAHEWGHNWDLRHAPGCGAGNPDPGYPHADGKIGVWGMDISSLALKSPTVFYDFMTYCSTDWVSDYFYKKILEYRQLHDGGGSPPQPTPSLLVWGRVEADRIVLEPAFQVVAKPVLPQAGGDFRLQAFNAAGETVFSGSFDPVLVADDPNGSGQFAFAIPLAEFDGSVVESLQVSGGGREQAAQGRRPLPPMGAPAEPSVGPAGIGSIDVTWNAAAFPMALIRDAGSGQIISFARGGRIRIPDGVDEIEITLSDGVRSTPRTLHRVR